MFLAKLLPKGCVVFIGIALLLCFFIDFLKRKISKLTERENTRMYKNYYVNKNTTGNPNYNHEVHEEGCQWIPSISNRYYLGYFSSCTEAVKKAKEIYTNVDGCATCCPLCHKK